MKITMKWPKYKKYTPHIMTDAEKKDFLKSSELRYEYDERGNIIRWDSIIGEWQIQQFNDNNQLIFKNNSFGEWTKYDYDERGNETYCNDNRGREIFYTYDDQDRVILCRSCSEKDDPEWYICEIGYDDKGRENKRMYNRVLKHSWTEGETK